MVRPKKDLMPSPGADALPAPPPPPPAPTELSVPTPAGAQQPAGPSTQELLQIIAGMQQQFNQLTESVSTLAQLATSGRVSQAALRAGPAAVAPVEQSPVIPAPTQSGEEPEFYWVRIKPYDEQRGQLRRRQYFNELGRAIDGGTGKPNDIPEWVKVNPDQALAMSRYRQNDDDPMSPPVCDIATDEERRAIDQSESQLRAATLGLIGLTPQAILQAARGAGQINAQSIDGTIPRPGMMKGAAAYQQPQPQPQSPSALPKAKAAGRMAALAGVPAAASRPPVASSRGVSEDLTAEAAVDREAAEALRAAEKYENMQPPLEDPEA